ncbi:hypothetical protein GCM10008955_33710 [Deinococcus malanensis]|uniref:DUF2269 family protein n=1 Tax=Deinococcus malanensis TaxID=1706855 RepID=A0ABQ2F0S9_9DEIO|nr:hypothetical protein [Deinococcus malanensis]GGK37060.1 hypothetical protein GCM10008955_33710 [Deinococcus malanensis]
MSLVPGVRKAALTLHITASVGWVGAAISYLVLAVAAMNSHDVQMLRTAWMGMEVIA